MSSDRNSSGVDSDDGGTGVPFSWAARRRPLRATFFRPAVFRTAVLRVAILRPGVFLRVTDFRAVVFRAAVLRAAVLRPAGLRAAVLRVALLRAAVLRPAVLRAAVLRVGRAPPRGSPRSRSSRVVAGLGLRCSAADEKGEIMFRATITAGAPLMIC